MRSVFWCALVALAIGLPACAGNLVSNGDFEKGDLIGWTLSEQKTGKGWQGETPVPTQVFCEAAPMAIHEIYIGGQGDRHIRRIGIIKDVIPPKGYAVGWTRAGIHDQRHPWISQIIRVEPGRYIMNASCDGIAANLSYPEEKDVTVGSIVITVDDNITPQNKGTIVFSRAFKSNESKGKWVTKSVSGVPLETKTGYIQVKLQFVDDSETIAPPKYSYVAFDNVSLELTPAPPEQAPAAPKGGKKK
ncbi:MAG: hypothetical protein K6U00_09225 [Armatimonadetes bacterium]|nr:hypothetical protein [Armatimonadota bacterium]